MVPCDWTSAGVPCAAPFWGGWEWEGEFEDITPAQQPTFLTVGLPVFHVEEAVPKGLLAGCTDEAAGVPRLPQGVHHLLREGAPFRPGCRGMGRSGFFSCSACQAGLHVSL